MSIRRPMPSGGLLDVVLALALCVVSAGCSGNSAIRSDATFANEPATVGDYLIGPGDRLEIFVWRQPELSVEVPVRPDGRISTPLVEDMVAVGKSPTQLAHEIRDVLSEYIRSPEVNVIVREFVGTFGNQIRVLGEATQPSAIPYRDRLTLMDVMIEVGGLTEFAAGNRGRIIRTVDGQSREIRVRLDDLINRGRVDQNVAMQPGDVLIIPQAIF